MPSARDHRRNWDMNSVGIKITTGDKRKVKAPDRQTERGVSEGQDCSQCQRTQEKLGYEFSRNKNYHMR